MSSQPRRVGVPRNISPLAWGAGTVSRPQVPKLKHHGGKVLGNVEVLPIYWGRFWALAAGQTLSSELNRFFDVVLASNHAEKLAEYYTHETQMGRGKLLNALLDANENPGTLTKAGQIVSDAQVQVALRQWITEKKVPEPSANSLYFVFLPPGISSQQSTLVSCRDYCGYHSSAPHAPQRIRYAVDASLGCASCSFGTDLDTLTKSASHLLWEAITDPDLDGWFEPYSGEELSDLSNDYTTRVDGFLVQAIWSNKGG